MKNPVIAIGLDAADPKRIEEWMSAGRLGHLSRLRARGIYGRLSNFEHHRAEIPWTTFLTGCRPQKTGYWGPYAFGPDDYSVSEGGAYGFSEYAPFYALGERFRVAILDMPQARIAEQVSGLQVLGWGTHSPLAPSQSSPAGLLEELTARHGEHPAFQRDYATLWHRGAIERLEERMKTGIRRRTAICRDLLGRGPWDLFLTAFAEPHVAGHFFWHLSQPDHPLHPLARSAGDPLLEIYQAADEAVGELVAAAPTGARVVVFSLHGMESNSMDLPSMLFLPELLYRFAFPGRQLLAAGGQGEPPPMLTPGRRGWTGELWRLRHDPNPFSRLLRAIIPTPRVFQHLERLLGAAFVPALYRGRGPIAYDQPAMWYREHWPTMKAFALPSSGEGYVRLNVQGRERSGIVEASAYDAVCDEIVSLVMGIKDARTGQGLVRRVVRTRQSAADADPKLPDPDLIVLWNRNRADVVDTPLGRIGPAPFNRAGSHVGRGFILASGPGLPPGSSLPDGHALDLPPTLLEMMGAPIPEHLDGRPLWTMRER